MKKCPYCHAAIEDNARFCLYCMRELEEKAVLQRKSGKKRVLLMLLFLLPLLTTGIVLLLTKSTESSSREPVATTHSGEPVATTHSEEPVATTHSEEPVATTHSEEKVPTTVAEEPTTVQLGVSREEIVYTYRSAEQFSIFGQNDRQKDIVITGVQTVAADGLYCIPATIDGKTVVAVDEGAFSAAEIAKTVKAVYLPDTLKGIYRGAFTACSGLEGVYITGERINIENGAFEPVSGRTAVIIIYSSAACKNGADTLLSKLYTDVEGFSWKEWDGVMP